MKRTLRSLLIHTNALMVLATVAMLSQIRAVQADLITYWNLNNATAGSAGTFNTTGTVEIYDPATTTLSPATSGAMASASLIDFSNLAGFMGGSANNNWGTFAGDATNLLSGDATGSGQALAVIGSGNNGHYVTFQTSTLGYDAISLSYATRGTATGYSMQTWSYSINGTDFTPISTISGRNVTSWSRPKR